MESRGKKPGWNPRSAPGRGEDHLPTISPGEKGEGQRREEPGGAGMDWISQGRREKMVGGLDQK